MATQRITVNLPENLFERIRQRAEQSQRSVESELIEVVASASPVTAELTSRLTELLSQMAFLDDKALLQSAHSNLSKRAQARLQALNYKRQREGLSELEARESSVLLKEYERVTLVRAQALSLLRERGHDLSEFASKRCV